MTTTAIKASRVRTRAAGGLLLAVFLGALNWHAAALQWETVDGYRVARLPDLGSTKTGFTLVPASHAGVEFTSILPEARIMLNANLLNGSGVALGDYDGDGLCDLYLCDLNGTNA